MSAPGITRAALDVRVNGIDTRVEIGVQDTIADVVRDRLGLTGTKVSCDAQVCGTCTVLLDGLPVSGCTVLAIEAADRELTTIEGLVDVDGRLHPLQQAFLDQSALQCGYCTPGMILASLALLRDEPDPSTERIAEWLEGNICRCTGYLPIVNAVVEAAAETRR
jgi:carbon-monoxide dehydrogenase small subunit